MQASISQITYVLGNSDAEVVVAVMSVVTTSPGAGDVHTLDTVLLSYCSDYPAELPVTPFDTGMSMRLGPKAHLGSTYSEDLDTTVLHIFLM